MATYVAVEGLIGAGKTTLAHLLARERGARLVLEPSERNPFLEPFYRNPDRYAFPAQMAYLLQRWRQQQAIRQQDLFQGLVVSDYVWQKDRLFAEKTLTDGELDLYDRFVDALGETGPVPDLLVWLEAPVDLCLRRIARRRAPGEDVIGVDYLYDLRERYERLLAAWTACPILRLDSESRDLVDDRADQAVVIARIEAALEGLVVDDALDEEPSLFG